MESKNLECIINTQLFIPLEEEQVKQLHEVTMLLIEDIDFEMVEDFTRAFFAKEVSSRFRKMFELKYKKEYGEDILMPSIVFIILEIYVIHLAIQSDDIKEDDKKKYSLIVRNFAILRKGNWNGILCPEWIIKIYAYYDEHKCKPINVSQSFSQLINSVVPCNKWTDTGLDINDQTIYNQLRSLSAAGFRVKFNAYVNSTEYKSIKSPFIQVYLLVIKMTKEWQWKYIEAIPVARLKEVLGDEANKRRKISNIVIDVRKEIQHSELIKPTMNSSVILNTIYDFKYRDIESFMFTALEFGVYMYYEMILETYNNK